MADIAEVLLLHYKIAHQTMGCQLLLTKQLTIFYCKQLSQKQLSKAQEEIIAENPKTCKKPNLHQLRPIFFTQRQLQLYNKKVKIYQNHEKNYKSKDTGTLFMLFGLSLAY